MVHSAIPATIVEAAAAGDGVGLARTARCGSGSHTGTRTARGSWFSILTSTDACLTEQYQALIATEGVTLEFRPEAIRRLAEIAFSVNETTENIGARRLHTVLEKLLEEISFESGKAGGGSVVIDAAYVDARLVELSRNEDLARYVL